jgi:hypothetical protein
MKYSRMKKKAAHSTANFSSMSTDFHVINKDNSNNTAG